MRYPSAELMIRSLTLAHGRPWQPGPELEVARRGWAVLQPPTGEAGPFGEPDDAGTGARDGRGTSNSRRQRVADLDGQAVAGRSPYGHRHLGAVGVLAGIGESLLHDSVRAAPDHRR